MDPLTHTLVGAAIARTRIAQGTRLATAALVLGANLPDVDIASALLGADASLAFRRGWTHGPLALALLPAILVAVLLAWARLTARRDPTLDPTDARRLLALSYLGCVTHSPLDWLNTYGIRLLMPFDDRWFYGDALFIVDPWIWLVLGGALVLGSARGWPTWAWAILAALATWLVLRSGELVHSAARVAWVTGLVAIVALRVTRVGPGPARLAALALSASLTYILAMIGATTIGAYRVERELTDRGLRAERWMVGPTPANPLVWDVVADLGDRYVHGTLAWSPAPALTLAPAPIVKPTPSPVLDRARAAPDVQGALGWMRFPYAEVDESADGFTVWFLDARYARARTRGFGAAVVELPRE